MSSSIISHASAQGLRAEQQDRYVAAPLSTGYLLAVMDGHGGARTADILQSHLSASFQLAITADTNPPAALKAMIQRLAQRTAIETSGSTLSVVFIPEDQSFAYVAVLGDSPVMITDAQEVWHFSPMHNARSNPQERSAALAKGARYSEGYLEDPQVPGHGLQLSRGLGDRDLTRILNREPESYRIPLGKNSLVVLATDGILDSFEDVEGQLKRIAGIIKSGGDAQSVVNDALKRKTGDNVTTIIWKAAR